VTTPVDEGASAAAAGVRAALGDADLAALSAAAAQAVADAGMAIVGAAGPELLRVDPVPRVVDGVEWDRLAAGLAQRVRALEAFLRDPSRAVAAGVVPAEAVATCLWLEGAPPPTAVGVAGPDVVRTPAGELVVLEDNLRTPTLMGYAETVRRVVGDLVPGRPRSYADDLVPALSAVLRAAAPDVDEPVVAVLGDVRGTNVRWEPARVAGLLGLPLVDLDELVPVGDRLRLPDGRLVDVLWRRTSEERLRGDDGRLNRLGEALWPGIASGRLHVVNPFGTGLADDKRTYPYVEDLVRFELGEEPGVRSVRCYDLGDATAREEAVERLDELVLKPRTGSGGRGVTVMPRASAARRARARAEALREPGEWVAQELVLLSTCPTVVDGRLEDRHVDLRPCVLSDGASVTVLPGGLTRVAPRAGELVVNCSQGGAAKDTWVVDLPPPRSDRAPAAPGRTVPAG
jgi:carboxylate-amine ligase